MAEASDECADRISDRKGQEQEIFFFFFYYPLGLKYPFM